MISAFLQSSDADIKSLDNVTDIVDAWRDGGKEIWVDIQPPAESEVRTVAGLFGLAPDAMVDNYQVAADRYEDQLEELEDRSLEPDVSDSILTELQPVRRQMLELRRLAASQRELITPIASGECDYISDNLEQRFSHVRDHLTKVVETIDAQRELLSGVRDNYESRLSQRMNQTVKTLTIFASVLLPLSLIAGIYGMNVPLWPHTDHPLFFWCLLGVMLLLALSMVRLFRRRKWL